eukprot:767529-Hanusia_phi.AAC.6
MGGSGPCAMREERGSAEQGQHAADGAVKDHFNAEIACSGGMRSFDCAALSQRRRWSHRETAAGETKRHEEEKRLTDSAEPVGLQQLSCRRDPRARRGQPVFPGYARPSEQVRGLSSPANLHALLVQLLHPLALLLLT